MKQVRSVLLCVLCGFLYFTIVESFGIVDMVSNYAKVVGNRGRKPDKLNTTTTTTVSPQSLNNSEITGLVDGFRVVPLNDTESNSDDYEDFDDFDPQESVNPPIKSYAVNVEKTMKYLSGMINILALLYQFNGRPESSKPQKVHYKREDTPRLSSLITDINNLQENNAEPRKYYAPAQDRYNPETASKKFKKQAAAKVAAASAATSAPSSSDGSNSDFEYQPIDVFPPYNPYSAVTAETYNKDDMKTSYDADFSSYQKPKNPMKDYMHQNDQNVDIQPSYSYEVPQSGNHQSSMTQDDDENNVYSSWNSGSDYSSYKPKKNIYPVYSAPTWNKPTSNEMQPMKTKYADYDSQPMPHDENAAEEPDHFHSWDPKPHPDGDEQDDDDDSPPPPVPPKKKAKIPKKEPPQPIEDDDEDKHPVYKQNYPGGLSVYDHDFHSYPYDHKPIDYHDLPPDHHDEEKDMADEDRDSKRPYSYYFLGRKLWYIPLLFSVYFIFYIGALVLKSIARHKIQFPEKLWDLHDEHNHHDHDRRGRKIDDSTKTYEKAIEKFKNKFM